MHRWQIRGRLCARRATRTAWVAAALLTANPIWAETTAPLSLSQAVELALKNNLGPISAREHVAQARGEKGLSLSALLPNVAGAVSQSNLTANLAAQGLPVQKLAGFPAFVGPFNRFDARVTLAQRVFDLASIYRYQASGHAVELARARARLTEEQITTATSLAYIAMLEAGQTVEAAEANVELAERLLKLARNQRQAGVAAGIDVARAETRLANQQVQLAQAKTQLDTARLDLLRLIGAPLADRPVLSGKLQVSVEADRDVEASVRDALSTRAEASVSDEALKIAEAQRKAALAGYAPSVSFYADYGSSGLKPNELNLPTRTVGVRMDIPIFDGGRTRSEAQVAASRRREAEAQLRDVRAAIERDVRLAAETLTTRAAQARAAEVALNLATRELELARDRFSSGVGDNVEVVQAQTGLENARLTRVASLAAFNLARLNMAAALGRAGDFQL